MVLVQGVIFTTVGLLI